MYTYIGSSLVSEANLKLVNNNVYIEEASIPLIPFIIQDRDKETVFQQALLNLMAPFFHEKTPFNWKASLQGLEKMAETLEKNI